MIDHRLYKYNSETESYELYKRKKKDNLISFVRFLIFSTIMGALTFIIFYFFIGAPAEDKLLQENKALLNKYQIITSQLDEALKVLDDIQQRDDKLYRILLQGEPIASETRRAAFENSQRYDDLLSLQDADLVISASRKMDLLSRQLYIQSNSLDEIVELSLTHEDKLRSIPSIQPISNKDLKRTASGYGWRIDPVYKTRTFHKGMDFTAETGTPIFATGNGTVTSAGWQRGYGYTVDIDHGYDYVTRYAHMDKVGVKKGQKVNRGDEIGLVGNTGKSTGPHLHYEVIHKGSPVNPINYYFMDLSPEEYETMVQLSNNQGQVMD